jgi:hypothetical protein
MADFTPVASQSRPPQPMTLGEMMNIANSAQAYQQAQQLNPLNVQRASAELSRLQQLTPEEVRRATAEANVSEQTEKPRIATSKATASSAESTAEQDRLKLMNQKLKHIASSQVAMINNPLIIQAEKNPTAANTEVLKNLVLQNGMRMGKDLGIAPDETQNLLQPYLDLAQNDPGKLRQYFKERHIAGLDESARTAVLSPSGVETSTGITKQITSTNPFSEFAVGTPITGTNVDIKLMPNETVVTDTQNNSFIISRDNNGKIIGSRPIPVSGGGAPPAPAPTAPAAANVPAANAPRPVVAPKPNPVVQNIPAEAPTENLPVHSQPVPPRFPVRQPGQPVFNLQQGEKEAQTTGGDYLRNVVAQRGSVAPIRNNLEKIMSTTDDLLAKQGFQAGKGLQIEQYLTKLVDDSEYKTLSKNLANLQIALIGNNPAALSSDAGKQMTAAASGSEVYPPKVLQKIAIQLHGEMENRDRQGIAADKYARKFGESNMPSFTQMWNNNADNKVFELMSLPKLIKDPQTRSKMADEIIGYPKGSEQRKVFEQKYLNIQKLIKDGTL